MDIKQAWVIHRTLDTREGINQFIEMVIRNDNYQVMDDINCKIGKLVDEIAKEHGVPFDFDKFYRHAN